MPTRVKKTAQRGEEDDAPLPSPRPLLGRGGGSGKSSSDGSPSKLTWGGRTVSQVHRDAEVMIPGNEPLVRSTSSDVRAHHARVMQQNQRLEPEPEPVEEQLPKRKQVGFADGESSPRAQSPSPPSSPRAKVAIDPLRGQQAWLDWYLSAEETDDEMPTLHAYSLHWAAGAGMQHLVGKLIRQGASLGNFDARGRTALNVAARAGHVDVVEAMLEYDCPADLLDKHGRSALMMAAAAGAMDVVQLLMEYKDVDAEAGDWIGTSAAMLAAGGGHAELLGSLLGHVRVNWDTAAVQRDREQLSPLGWACRAGEPGANCVHVLLSHGANPSGTDFRGRTMLGWAAVGGSVRTVAELCDVLLSHPLVSHPHSDGAVREIENAEWLGDLAGASPLLLAVFAGHAQIVDLLISHGADPAVRSNDSRCALWALATGLQDAHYLTNDLKVSSHAICRCS